jgi:hypothetical protein
MQIVMNSELRDYMYGPSNMSFTWLWGQESTCYEQEISLFRFSSAGAWGYLSQGEKRPIAEWKLSFYLSSFSRCLLRRRLSLNFKMGTLLSLPRINREMFF